MADPFCLSGELTVTAAGSGEDNLVAAWSLRAPFGRGFQAVAFEVPWLGDSGPLALDCPSVEPPSRSCDVSLSSDACMQMPISIMQPWFKWWLKSVWHTGRRHKTKPTTLFLILPIQSGYPIRADILQMRLGGWSKTTLVFSRDEQEGPVSAIPVAKNVSRLGEVFNTAIGAVLLNAEEDIVKGSSTLDELDHRLALPLVVGHHIAQHRVVLVTGGYNLAFRKQLFSAAAGLGMLLVVIDEPGHWPQTGLEAVGAPMEFLPLNMTIDNELPTRITGISVPR
ncbi:hypothetical protein CGMCC3_g17219 [Colletotrichum fructicola]|nr:uncharacterized protein CGMCC3_g17219 [Colletotrichum fructicola]KAE9566627.1 hypothetical protein CGMCC3_g17219 [Colletotrichum fructicola]KAF4417597.1 hypothetical protein CFRS1_v015665 [Colletotrichum fructicola]